MQSSRASHSYMHFINLPNALSASRLLLALAMAFCVYDSRWEIAVTILWIAIATDVADGYLARALGSSSAIGGLLDHGSDAFFVTLTVAALTTQNLAPVILALMIPAAFLQYMFDSRALTGQPLRASALGRYNGIAYYVFAGFPIMQIVLGITLIPFDWFIWIGWGLVLTTVISMTDRLVTLLSSR